MQRELSLMDELNGLEVRKLLSKVHGTYAFVKEGVNGLVPSPGP